MAYRLDLSRDEVILLIAWAEIGMRMWYREPPAEIAVSRATAVPESAQASLREKLLALDEGELVRWLGLRPK